MDTMTKSIPAIVVRSVGSGLFLMSLFTTIWTGIAYGGGLAGNSLQYLLLIFIVFILLFIIQGFRFFLLAKKYSVIQTEEDRAEGKKMGKWFGIIFGAEGLLIFLGVNLVFKIGHPDLVVPVIALIVGLHFFPLAHVFKRNIDYWLASWTVIIALLGIVFTFNNTLSTKGVAAFVGIGVAIATSCYGLYMIAYGNKLIKNNPPI